MSAAHRRYLIVEAAIGAAINGVLSLIFCLLVFGGRAAVSVRGAGGLIVDAAPQSFMVALMSMLVPTLLTRGRVRGGKVPALAGRPPRGPRHAGLRAGAVAITVALVAVAAQAALLSTGPPTWPFGTVLIAKTIYGAVLGAAISLAAVRLALRDV